MPDLITLAALKAWIPGLSATVTTADQKLAGLITATSNDFLRACNRPDLLQANYTEARIGDGSCRLALRHWPVTAIASLTIGGIAVAPSPDNVQAGWYLPAGADPELDFVLYQANSTFADGQSVVVGYTAGYAVAPPEVQQTVMEWAALRYQRAATTGQTQNRNSEGDHTDFTADDIPPNTKRVIERYTRAKPSYAVAAPVPDGPTARGKRNG